MNYQQNDFISEKKLCYFFKKKLLLKQRILKFRKKIKKGRFQLY